MKSIPINKDLKTIEKKDYHYDLKNGFNYNNLLIQKMLSDLDWKKRSEMQKKGIDNYYYVQYSKINQDETNCYTPYTNPFLSAFMNAYNNHEDIVLSPDDIWTAICLNFSKFVNDNSEELRSLFVEHSGKVKLTVTEEVGHDENDWTNFFGQMKKKIGENVKGDVVSLLSGDYSTSGLVESIVSSTCIMDTFKSYFEYGRCIPCCGIRNVLMMGTLDDWNNLKDKAIGLRNFCDKRQLTNYIDNLLPILQEFINTYQENPNVDWWNRIMDFERGSLGSGSTTYISGWILDFFMGCSGRSLEFPDLKMDNFKVEVSVENHCTGQKKKCYVLGGFVGVRSDNGEHRPLMGVGVVEDKETVESL